MRSGKGESMRRYLLLITPLLLAAAVFGQAPATPPPSAPAPAAAAPAAPPKPIMDADLKAIETPKPEVRAKGDPDGNLTGTAADVVSDPKKGLTLGDVANQIGQNKIAINFMWTLVTGFLVMFMQAGFAI